MKKRVIAVVLSLLLILSLAACAQKTQSSPDHATDAVPSNTTADNTADSATPQSEEPSKLHSGTPTVKARNESSQIRS